MKNKLFILIFLLLQLSGYSSEKDSLLSIYDDQGLADTTRLNALHQVTVSYIFTNPDSAIYYANMELGFAIKRNLENYQAEAYQNIATSNYVKQQIDTAIFYYLKGIDLYQKLKIESGQAAIHNNIGIMYEIKGEYLKALQHYLKGLSLREKEKERQHRSIGKLSLNIGNVYINLKEYNHAIEYYSKAHYIFKLEKDSSNIAKALMAFGLTFNGMKQSDSALTYFNRALQIHEKLGDQMGLTQCKTNIGVVYLESGEYEKAQDLFRECIDYYQSIDDQMSLATIYENLGSVNLHFNNYKKSIAYCTQALEISKNYKMKELEKNSCKCLYKAYRKSNNSTKALEYFEEFIHISDSIKNENITKQIARTELQYEYDKKMLSDSLERAEIERIKELEYTKKVEQQKTFTYAGIIGAAFLLVILLVLYRGYTQKKRSNVLLEEKNELITLQKKEVETQKYLVEEKSKEIKDSIEYARNIQHAILPAMSLFNEYLPDGFVLFHPKDVVSGDFYWMETVNYVEQRVMGDGALNSNSQNTNLNTQPSTPNTQPSELILFAAADCTGHGVPGAMVSVVCHNALNRSVKEFGLTDPGEILNKVRELVIETFAKSNKEVKDGMDIALCSLKTQTTNNKLQTTIEYAGANNPLWIIRPTANCHPERSRGDFVDAPTNKELEDYLSRTTDNYQLLEIKPNKQPVGQHPDPKPFITHTLELEKGDSIYLFTDGFPDQFGGPRNKKLKYKPFMEMLLKHNNESSESQKQSLLQEFQSWKGDNEQIDDVCILCVKI